MYKKIFLIIIILSISTALFAQQSVVDGSDDILSSLQTEFLNQLSKWVEIVQKYALNLFMLLASLNLIVRMIFLLIEGADFQKTISYLTKYVFITGLFFYFLQSGIILGQAIVNSFLKIGYEGARVSSNSVSVENILGVGWDIVEKSLKDISLLKIPSALVKIILGLATYFVLLLIVANYIIEMLSVWILVYLGYFLLAFGGSEWTREVAISYVRALISGGMRLMVIIFMIGLAIQIIDDVVSGIDPATSSSMVYAFTISMLLYMLMTKLPDAISSMITGAWGQMGSINMASGTVAGMTAIKMGGSIINQSVSSAKSFKAGVTDHLSHNQNTSSMKTQNRGSGASYVAGKGIANLSNKVFGKAVSSDSPFNESKSMTKKNDDNGR